MYLTVGTWADESAVHLGLHRQPHLLPLDPGAVPRLPHHPRLPLALGHRLVLVLARDVRAEAVGAPARAQAAAALRHVLEGGGLRAAARLEGRARPPARQARAGAGRAGRRGADRSAAGVPRLLPPRGRHRAGLGLPAASARRRAGRGTSTCSTRRPPTPTSASGPPPRSPRAPRTGTTTDASSRWSTELGGRKSLYSTSYYSEDEFWATYGGATYDVLKKTYDPEGRLLDLYEKTVRRR